MTVMDPASRQRHDALRTANERRVAVSDERKRIRALSMRDGLLAAAGLLDGCSENLASMKVGHLLSSIRKVGRGKAGRFLRHAEVVSWDRRLRDLSVRQRGVLAAELRRKAKR